MAEAIIVSDPISETEKTLTFQTGKLARQADGSVLVQVGETVVLVTATASRSVRDGQDFFPLTVDVEERMYAAGKIPGSFFRREGRATDQATLTARLIDRPLRPCFPDGFRNEVHVVATVFGADQENPYDVLAINGASAALMISGIPFDGPVGAVRLAYTAAGIWLPNPTYQEGDASSFEIVVAGRAIQKDGKDEIAIMMVEAGATEKAFENFEQGSPKVTEQVIAEGLEAAKTWIKESIDLQKKLVEKAGAKPTIAYDLFSDYTDEIYEEVVKVGGELIKEANSITTKHERLDALAEATKKIQESLAEAFPESERQIAAAARSYTKKLVRKRILEEGIRIDGRGVRDIRPLSAEVGLISTAHGSGLFERGDTQVLNIATLGMPKMNQLLDSIGTEEHKRYIHHYNFPPYSTGDVGFMRGPKRREIGHGLLAERALLPVIPPEKDFPYTLRLVSEAVSSDGSTSMASVCGSTLSLMDAGVPIIDKVGGIAMGLISDEGHYVTLTDILGAEDAFGDMDFKVAGTKDVVTALQLDTKIDGLPAEVLAAALEQAKEARLKVLSVLAQAIAEPRSEVKTIAPKIISFEVPLDKVGEIIGPKGKTINTLQQETGAEISIDDDGVVGQVIIGAKDSLAVNEAKQRIDMILNPPVAEIGATYVGKVVSITKFGAFINILPQRDGLLHISKLSATKRVERVEDVLSLGEEVKVIVQDIDDQGKISLLRAPELTGDQNADPVLESQHDNRPAADEQADGSDRRGASQYVTFEDEFAQEISSELGDLGYANDKPFMPPKRNFRPGGPGRRGGQRR
ncbi:MAG: polyribonucleotide nucleotidyltransferase [Firmicutes bacterium]|jgi:polyribonucleotide nucleotidyltransferase|nr:polyribonucleotide nucleotidyltransferase [Bacillota bacterium]